MKQKIIYGTSALVSLAGLIFSIGVIYNAYVNGFRPEFVQILLAILLLVLVVCEITKIIKKYDDSLSKMASLINICFFITGILLLVGIKHHDFIDFTNIIWGAGSIFIGYALSFVTNIVVIIRHTSRN